MERRSPTKCGRPWDEAPGTCRRSSSIRSSPRGFASFIRAACRGVGIWAMIFPFVVPLSTQRTLLGSGLSVLSLPIMAVRLARRARHARDAARVGAGHHRRHHDSLRDRGGDRSVRIANALPAHARARAREAPRQLSARGEDRRGRHGRGVAREASSSGAAGGDQAHPPGRAWRRRELAHRARSLRAGSAGHFGAELPALHRALRFRSDRRRHVLLRHGAPRWTQSARAGGALRAAARGARGVLAQAGLPLAGRRARPRHHPSRREAGEPVRLPPRSRSRLREGAGLWAREASRKQGADAAHHGRNRQRHAGVHGAGDGHRRSADRRSRGSLRVGMRRLLALDREAGLRGRQRDADAASPRARSARASLEAHRAPRPSRARRAHSRSAREGS